MEHKDHRAGGKLVLANKISEIRFKLLKKKQEISCIGLEIICKIITQKKKAKTFISIENEFSSRLKVYHLLIRRNNKNKKKVKTKEINMKMSS